jgi:hypothetical protein
MATDELWPHSADLMYNGAHPGGRNGNPGLIDVNIAMGRRRRPAGQWVRREENPVAIRR